MPPCVTLGMENVQQMMNQLNLVAVFEPAESSKPEGEVLTQSVETGAQVPEGSTVTFTYSDGEKLIRKDVHFALPDKDGDVLVEVYLDTTQVFSSDLPGDYGGLDLSLFEKAGSYTLRLYVDEELTEEREIEFSE